MNDPNHIADRRSRLSPARQAILDRRLRGKRAAETVSLTISRLVDRDDTPLSFAQRRLWFAHQWDTENTTNNRPMALGLKGKLQVPSLEKSLCEIIRRHEILRTTFPTINGQPVQRVDPTPDVTLPIEDLTHQPQEDRLDSARQQMTGMLLQPFRLDSGPLVRVRLFKLDSTEHLLFFVTHHILFDGWSEVLFVNELCSLYEAFKAGEGSRLPDLPVQYSDFANWQIGRNQENAIQAQSAYWREALDGVLPVLDLPTDHPRPPAQTYHGATQTLVLPAALVGRLEAVSRQQDVTLFMTLLAAFKVMLSRYTDQADIIVGTPVAGRRQPETEKLIGAFVNLLPLRTDMSGNPTFRELLQRIRKTCLGAYANQDLPFDTLVAELNPERDLSRSPVFQVFFNLDSLPDRAKSAGDIQLAPFDIDPHVALYDLSVELMRTEAEIRCAFVYNTDLFDAAAIQRMVGHYLALLEELNANLERPISDLPLLSAEEQYQVLVEWNETQTEYDPDLGIHQLFEAQVGRTPDATAVIFNDQALTYRELNQKANQLARRLQKLGVGPEVVVGLCVERSLEMMIGLLGILKAGGAYLPLDPSYPKERLAFMMEDSAATVLLTLTSLLSGLPFHSTQTICLDGDWETIDRESSDILDRHTNGDNLAYVIYTSGSTGLPKGVGIIHRAVTNILSVMQTRLRMDSLDVLAAVSAISFDISVLELFLPLIVGAKVIIIDHETAEDAQRLRNKLEGSDTTVLQATPTTWQMLMWAAWPGGAGIKALSGGERLPRSLIEELLPRVNELWNLYGPTETTIYSLASKVFAAANSVPIGQPVANTQVYVLNSSLQPAPIGVPGELYIAGEGLARGYLNRPDLTAERFIPNPFSRKPGMRLYRTGDMVRYLPDGNIEFLGRSDHQVKIRGFRIELGEIETVLEQHPAVRQAVILARDATPGDSSSVSESGIRLLAYVISKDAPVPPLAELRSFLKEKLPDYMLPSVFIFLEALPLTPNGKVNRAALPAPDQSRPELEKAFVAPSTPIEIKLVEIWSMLLGLDQVGIQDDFFELGGHSLLATQVISRSRETFQIEIPLRSLFEIPTIAGLAEQIEVLIILAPLRKDQSRIGFVGHV